MRPPEDLRIIAVEQYGAGPFGSVHLADRRRGTSTPASNRARTHHSAHPSLVPFQAFEAKDGWMVVGCAKEKFWVRLCEVVGHPEWSAAGSPYATFALRGQRRTELLARLEAVLREKTVDEWLEQFYAASIPCAGSTASTRWRR